MSEDNVNGNNVVRYTVKELLQDIRDGLSRLDGKLDTKADKTDVVGLAVRVDAVEDSLSAIQISSAQKEHDDSESRALRRWIAPVVMTALIALPSWVQQIGHLFK